MTRQQALWAMQHDWCRGYFQSEASEYAVIGRADTGEEGDIIDHFGQPVRVFTDYRELRAWAGY